MLLKEELYTTHCLYFNVKRDKIVYRINNTVSEKIVKWVFRRF